MCAKTWDSTNPPDSATGPTAQVSAAGPQGGGNPGHAISDARDTLEQLAAELRHAVLSVAWRQWRVLGAGAAITPAARTTSRADRRSGHLHTLIDPEALVLVSLTLVREERRLRDLLRDWGARNSDLLSVQRVKNLKADYPDSVRDPLARQLAWFATVARDVGKDLRWRSLAQGAGTEGHGAWFDSIPEKPEGFGGTGARAHGAYAPEGASTKSRATRARLMAGETLILRLRLGLGVGVKADLLGFLLARADEWATVRDIADAIGYTVAAVRRAAEDLAAARFVEALDGQPTSYRATYGAWAPLLGLSDHPPRWANWHERFVFATAFFHWAEAARERPLSAYAFGAHGRRLLEQYRVAFERDSIAYWSAHSQVQDWGAFVSQSVRSLAAWMEEMA